MGASQQALLIDGVIRTWSLSRKTSNVGVTGEVAEVLVGVLTVEEVRSNGSRSAGKRYYEVEATFVTGSSGSIAIGAATTAASVDGNLLGTGKFTYRSDGVIRQGSTTVGTGSSYGTGGQIGIAVDYDAGKIWFALNNTWQLSGDPAAGTNPSGTFTANTAMEALAWWDNQPANRSVTARFAPGRQNFSPPSGFARGF